MSEENEKQEGSLGTITPGRASLFHAAGVFLHRTRVFFCRSAFRVKGSARSLHVT